MDDRGTNGQFVKGNPGNPNATGRPKRKTEDKYLLALQKCVKAKDWKAICQRAVTEARGGDYRARQWLSDYLLGKPRQFVDVTSAGKGIPGAVIYLPEIDGTESRGLEGESGTAG